MLLRADEEEVTEVKSNFKAGKNLLWNLSAAVSSLRNNMRSFSNSARYSDVLFLTPQHQLPLTQITLLTLFPIAGFSYSCTTNTKQDKFHL
jgi:hypothetical protein